MTSTVNQVTTISQHTQHVRPTFWQPYYINFRAHYVECYMMHHRDPSDPNFPHWYVIHRNSDDVELGAGETKEDAHHAAAYAYPRKFDLTTV